MLKNYRYSFGQFNIYSDIGLFNSFDGYHMILNEKVFIFRLNSPFKHKIDVCRKKDIAPIKQNMYERLSKIFL